MSTHTHTLNPNTGREILINGVRFWELSETWIQVR